MYVTWIPAHHICDMTPCTAYAWHDSALHMCDMTPRSVHVWHDSLHTICVTRLLPLRGMIPVTVWHECTDTQSHAPEKYLCVTWILRIYLFVWYASLCDKNSCVMWLYVCHECLCVTWMFVCNMNVCVWHEYLRVTWILPICLLVWYESLCDVTLCVTWMLVCDMNAYMWHGFFPYVSLCDMHLCVTRIFVRCDSMCVMDACVWHECLCVTWVLPICLLVWSASLCDMNPCAMRLYVCHECLRVTWFLEHDFVCVTWILPIWVEWHASNSSHMSYMTPRAWHDSMCDMNPCVVWLFLWRACLCVTWWLAHDFVCETWIRPMCVIWLRVWRDSLCDLTLFFWTRYICTYSHMCIFTYVHILHTSSTIHTSTRHTHTHTHTHTSSTI